MGSTSPEMTLDVKAEKFPGGGSWEQPGRGDEFGIVVSPSFEPGIALRDDRS